MKISLSEFSCVLVIAAMIGLAPTDVSAEAIVWNAGDGNWSTSSSWSPQRVPAEADDVTIPAGPTVMLNNGRSLSSRNRVRSMQAAGNLTIDPKRDGPFLTWTELEVGAGGGEIGGLLTMEQATRLEASGGALTVTGSANINGANLTASNGGALTLSGPAQLEGVRLKASSGGALNIGSQAAVTGRLFASAYGSGSVVDLTAIPEIPQGSSAPSLTAEAGGTIKIPEPLTTLAGLGLYGDGRILGSEGNSALPQIRSLANGYLAVTQRNVPGGVALGSPDLSGLVNIDNTLIDVYEYGELALPGVTTIALGDEQGRTYGEMYYWVDEGSRLDLSSVSQIQASGWWDIQLDVFSGGYLDLSGVTEIPAGGFFDVEAWGSGTVIDFSSLRKIHSEAWIEVEAGATLLLGDAVEFTADSNTIRVTDGSNLAMGGLVVGEGTLLEAGGVISADLINEGTLAPGQSPGTLQVDNYTQAATGKLLIELDGTARGEYDVLQVNGSAQLDGLLELLVSSALEIDPTMEFHILSSSSLSGIFAGLEEGAVVWSELGGDGDRLFISYRDNGVFVMGSQVPEPSSMALLGSFAVAGVAFRQVRKKRLHKRGT
jgi:hypothetical protein